MYINEEDYKYEDLSESDKRIYNAYKLGIVDAINDLTNVIDSNLDTFTAIIYNPEKNEFSYEKSELNELTVIDKMKFEIIKEVLEELPSRVEGLLLEMRVCLLENSEEIDANEFED